MNLENYEKIKDLPNTTEGTTKLSKDDQKDITILRDIAIQFPERLGYDKLLSGFNSDKSRMKEIISSNPLALIYMSGKLKEDVEFLNDVLKSSSSVAVQNIILQNCNVMILDGKVIKDTKALLDQESIIDNARFTGIISDRYNDRAKTMAAVIAQEPAMILLVSDELKNNKDFIKTECFKNKSVLNQVVNNVKTFGDEGLLGAREANTEMAIVDGLEGFEQAAAARKQELLEAGKTEEEIQNDSQYKDELKHIAIVKRVLELPPEKRQRFMDIASKCIQKKSKEFSEQSSNNEVINSELKIRAKAKEQKQIINDEPTL